MNGKTLSLEQAAKKHGLHPEAIGYLVQEGHVAAELEGEELFVLESSLDSFIKLEQLPEPAESSLPDLEMMAYDLVCHAVTNMSGDHGMPENMGKWAMQQVIDIFSYAKQPSNISCKLQ